MPTPAPSRTSHQPKGRGSGKSSHRPAWRSQSCHRSAWRSQSCHRPVGRGSNPPIGRWGGPSAGPVLRPAAVRRGVSVPPGPPPLTAARQSSRSPADGGAGQARAGGRRTRGRTMGTQSRTGHWLPVSRTAVRLETYRWQSAVFCQNMVTSSQNTSYLGVPRLVLHLCF